MPHYDTQTSATLPTTIYYSTWDKQHSNTISKFEKTSTKTATPIQFLKTATLNPARKQPSPSGFGGLRQAEGDSVPKPFGIEKGAVLTKAKQALDRKGLML